MTQRSKLIQLSCVALLGIAAVSCGSDSKSSSSTAAATTTPTTAAAATTSPATVADTTAPASTDATASTEPTETTGVTETTGATGATDETESSGATGSSDAGEAAGSKVQLVDSDLGKILADGDGKVLYLFTKDTGTTSACAGDCATAWPALHGTAEPGAGLDEEDFATITGTDGQPQTTFYGHPLYYFSGDAAPGDVNGQGIGGVWFAVDAEGNPAGAGSTATTGY